jgi:nitroreductase
MSAPVLTPESLDTALLWRYATKKFDPSKKIPKEVWQSLEQSLLLSPSSFGLQPWKFFVVRNPEVRQQLVAASWNQTQVVEASHLVVLAIRKDVDDTDVDRHVARMAEVQKVPVDTLEKFSNVVKGFLEQPPYELEINAWSTRQVYIALGFFMLSAALLGIDTCPMEGFDPAQYDQILGLPEQGYHARVVCPAGYRAPDDAYAQRPKIRFPKESVIAYLD